MMMKRMAATPCHCRRRRSALSTSPESFTSSGPLGWRTISTALGDGVRAISPRRGRVRGARSGLDASRREGCRESIALRSEEHTSELQSRRDLVCRLLLEKKKLTDANYDYQ